MSETPASDPAHRPPLRPSAGHMRRVDTNTPRTTLPTRCARHENPRRRPRGRRSTLSSQMTRSRMVTASVSAVKHRGHRAGQVKLIVKTMSCPRLQHAALLLPDPGLDSLGPGALGHVFNRHRLAVGRYDAGGRHHRLAIQLHDRGVVMIVHAFDSHRLAGGFATN